MIDVQRADWLTSQNTIAMANMSLAIVGRPELGARRSSRSSGDIHRSVPRADAVAVTVQVLCRSAVRPKSATRARREASTRMLAYKVAREPKSRWGVRARYSRL